MLGGGTAAPFLGVGRSASGRLWLERACDGRAASALCQRLGLPEIVGRVLAARGVGAEDGEAFLNPSLREALPDPSGFRDMDRAADRIADAVTAGERIAIFGDYDVDGATSTALLRRFLEAAGAEVATYVPDRRTEGYGPNAPALLRLHAAGARLAVTVDCGVSAFAALEAAAAAGLDVIVVDHHQAEPRLPPAVAVVNPNRLDETVPHRQLAAVGVAFLLAVAVNRELRRRGRYGAGAEPDLMGLLDLVALGTVADVVPLTGLNRVLVAQGLKVMARRRNAGLKALADVAKLEARPDAWHLGFLLGPRVNAGGRVGRSDLGARLLSTDDPAEAAALAAELDALNAERKAIETEVEAQATADAARQENAPLLLVAREGWHEGVVGIVAGRLKDRFGRPAAVVALAGGVGKGSARSVPGVDIGAAVLAARQAGLLQAGGGHAMAAGFTVAAGELERLNDFLAARIGPQLAAAPAGNVLKLDGAVQVAGATRELADVLENAGPYGSGHPAPRLAVAAARVVRAQLVKESHVRLVLRAEQGAERLSAIAFRVAQEPLGRFLLASEGRQVHLAGRLQGDDWNGERRVSLLVDDAAEARPTA